MRMMCTAAAVAALLTPAFADDFAEVMVETSDRDGDQPAGLPLWQTVTVSWEGEVEVRHFSPLHSDRFRGVATADELAALERAVRKARLGEAVPAEFSAAPWSDKFQVSGGPARFNGETRGEVERAGALRARLEPLQAIALTIAERLVHPPALPDGQLRGRVEIQGSSAFLSLRGQRYRIRPYEVAQLMTPLDGEWILVAGEITSDSIFSRRVQVDALLEPTLADLSGEVTAQGDVLRVGSREVALNTADYVAEILEHLHGEVTLRGYVRSGPRGPRAMSVFGVLAVMVEDSYPLNAGDEVLIVEHSFGSRFRAERLSDHDETSVDRDEFELSPSSTGITAALGH